MTAYFTTAEVAAERNISPTAVRRIAKRLGIGEQWGGRAGYRFDEQARAAIAAAMKPADPVGRRRKRRSA